MTSDEIIDAVIEREGLCGPSPRSARVIGLFATSGPPAVRRLVIAVYINAVDRVLRGWARSHVRSKCGEVIRPSLAHGDTTPSVVLPSLIEWVRTAVLCGIPRTVFQGFPQAVFSGSRNCGVSLEASATETAATAQRFAGSRSHCAAVATALPLRSVIDKSRSSASYNEATKSLAGQVYRRRHDINYTSFTVMSTPRNVL